MGRTSTFIKRSGLDVEVKDLSSCRDGGDGKVIQQLIITPSSAKLFNKTAVQCVATRRHQNDSDFYSAYGMMIVDAVGKIHWL